MSYREEKDSMGPVLIPETAYYGAQTRRAVENFPVSGISFPPVFIQTLGLIKKLAAGVNEELGLLDPSLSSAIMEAAKEVAEGKFHDQFIVDIFQTGSGTSTHMNANEVIASRANEILTGKRGGKSPVHPNDHVNLGQSSNDVIPSAIHISALMEIQNRLIPALSTLKIRLAEKALEFKGVKKIGRTHLQDAVPVTMGEVFSGYARQVELGTNHLEQAKKGLLELALGGTAVGTGENTHPEFARRVIEKISAETGQAFREAKNHFEAQGARDAAVEVSGALKALAVRLIKIANDIRFLASGPRSGLGELVLQALQPGSSIMPGKVNPVIPEVVIQVAYQVMGNDTVIALGAQGGFFELNTSLPLICHNLLQSIALLASGVCVFEEKCIQGLGVDAEKCASTIEKSLALATALVPLVGYDRAAEIAKKAYETGKTIREIALEASVLPEDRLNDLFMKYFV
ncbi:MAG: class II fumarate hydratase [Proteobacteria bacterium]|nr:class II fumarate hydratase [Pseudomonadota bacterium]